MQRLIRSWKVSCAIVALPFGLVYLLFCLLAMGRKRTKELAYDMGIWR